MQKLLHFDPSKRPSASEALEHPYVAQFHDLAKETTAPRRVRSIIDDNRKMSMPVYRERLYHEITKLKRRRSEARRSAKACSAAAGTASAKPRVAGAGVAMKVAG